MGEVERLHQGSSADAREVWLDGWRCGWATRHRTVVTIYQGQPTHAPESLVKIWRDGWRYGTSARQTAAAISRLYAGRPPRCPVTGGPCAGEIGCRIVPEQRSGTTD